MNLPNRPGFTLIELLIVLGLLALLAVSSYSFFSTSIGTNQLKVSTWEITDTLRQAQNQAMTGQGNSVWGVHLQTDRFVLFQGSTYSAGDPNNVVTVLSNNLQITTISLNGGSSDVRFSKTKGETTDFGTVVLTDTNSNTTKTITITAVGRVDDNT